MYHEKTIPTGMVFFVNITDGVICSRKIRGAPDMDNKTMSNEIVTNKAIDYGALYLKMLREIYAARDRNENVSQYIFQNTDPAKMTLLPEYVRQPILNEYVVFLDTAKPENGICGNYLDNPNGDGVKVLSTELLPVWKNICDDRASEDSNGAEFLNQKGFTLSDFNKMGNAVMTIIPVKDNKEVYLLTAHRNVYSSLIGKMIFINNNCVFVHNRMKMKKASEVEYAEGEFLVLSSDVDAAIYDGCCFVFNASNFNRVFKYEEIQKQELDRNSGKITSLCFLSDGGKLLELVRESRSLRKELLKAIANGRLERFIGLKPKEIKELIEKRKTLVEDLAIQFDKDGRIMIDDKSYKNVVGILSDRIHIDFVFDTLNGVV